MRAVRARCAAAAVLVSFVCIAVHAHDEEAAAAARIPQRVALLQRAQAELERGDAPAALDDFERAAMMLHAADAELGLIRAAMQDGQYRRALAFCAHTAGEHTDDADGAALYAWLLRIGGQGALATRVIADARTLAPGDAVAAAADAALAGPFPVASGTLLAPPHRMAPWPVMLAGQVPPPASARFAGNATLVGGGSAALVPLAALGPAPHGRLWVRNGLGQASEAIVMPGDRTLSEHGLALLARSATLPPGGSRQAVGRAPFGGSPGYALAFAPGSAPAWPLLSQGFLGNPLGDGEVRKLGFASDPGAPVLDRQGALVGIAVGAVGAQATWLPLAALASTWAQPEAAAVSAPQASGLVAPDAIYESGLRRALQVLVAD